MSFDNYLPLFKFYIKVLLVGNPNKKFNNIFINYKLLKLRVLD